MGWGKASAPGRVRERDARLIRSSFVQNKSDFVIKGHSKNT